MHYFVVRQRIDEVFAVFVHHRKRQLVVRSPTKEWIDPEIIQRVVHPPHVPLERETQPTFNNGMRHSWPRGALLGNHRHAAMQLVHGVVELLQKRYRIQVFSPAKLVAHPLPRLAPIVEIQHGRDGIDTQTIDVKLFNPEQRVGQQEVAHFVSAVVENQRAPLGMFAQSRILMFITRGSVKATQCPIVLGKMRGHPIQQHTNPCGMHRIDKESKIVWRTMARCWCVVATDLISPRSAKRMFQHRQQLNMRETKFLDMLGQTRRDFAIRQCPIVFFRNTRPRGQMHLVHQHRFARRITLGTTGQPITVVPLVCASGNDHRCVTRRQFHLERHRIGLDA